MKSLLLSRSCRPSASVSFRQQAQYRLVGTIRQSRVCQQTWLARSQSLFQTRAQHDYPPHKEYFQKPGQIPLPDGPFLQPTPVAPTFRNERSFFGSILRSLLWAILFGALGVSAGAGAVTWEYLQPPFEPNSDTEKEMAEEIADMLDKHPVVVGLREEGWIEEQVYFAPTPAHHEQGYDLVTHQLTGTQGINMKEFTLPDAGYTMLVCYLGNGLEGWPDVIHGGTISTLFEEGLWRHVQKFYLDETRWIGCENLHIDFKKPLRPGEIYTVMLPPGSTFPSTDQDTGEATVQIKFVALLIQMELAPNIEIETTTEGKVTTTFHKVSIPSLSGEDKTHAQATSDWYLFTNPNQKEASVDQQPEEKG